MVTRKDPDADIRYARPAEALQQHKPVRGRKTKVLGVRLLEDVRFKVAERAAQQGVSPSEYVEYIVTREVTRRR